MKSRLSVTNKSLKNNLPTFRLNAPVLLGTRLELAFDLPTVQCLITLSHAKMKGEGMVYFNK